MKMLPKVYIRKLDLELASVIGRNNRENLYAFLKRLDVNVEKDWDKDALALILKDFIVENPEGCGVFCRNNNSAGVAVNSVAKGRNKGIFAFRVIFAFFVKIVLNPCDKRIRAPLVTFMNKKSRGFVNKNNVFVLVNNGNIRGRKHKFRALFFGFEKFVRNVALNKVAHGKTGGNFAALSVKLDSFKADVFIEQGRGKLRNSLGYKFIHSLACIVF